MILDLYTAIIAGAYDGIYVEKNLNRSITITLTPSHDNVLLTPIVPISLPDDALLSIQSPDTDIQTVLRREDISDDTITDMVIGTEPITIDNSAYRYYIYVHIPSAVPFDSRTIYPVVEVGGSPSLAWRFGERRRIIGVTIPRGPKYMWVDGEGVVWMGNTIGDASATMCGIKVKHTPAHNAKDYSPLIRIGKKIYAIQTHTYNPSRGNWTSAGGIVETSDGLTWTVLNSSYPYDYIRYNDSRYITAAASNGWVGALDLNSNTYKTVGTMSDPSDLNNLSAYGNLVTWSNAEADDSTYTVRWYRGTPSVAGSLNLFTTEDHAESSLSTILKGKDAIYLWYPVSTGSRSASLRDVTSYSVLGLGKLSDIIASTAVDFKIARGKWILYSNFYVAFAESNYFTTKQSTSRVRYSDRCNLSEGEIYVYDVFENSSGQHGFQYSSDLVNWTQVALGTQTKNSIYCVVENPFT